MSFTCKFSEIRVESQQDKNIKNVLPVFNWEVEKQE